MYSIRKTPQGERSTASNERVAIFIDGSNLYHALETNFHRHNLNFPEFCDKLVGNRRLFRIYYYNILQEPSQWGEGYRDQQDFLTVLRQTPYLEARLGTTKMGQGVQVEKGIDIMIATDMLYYAWSDFYDVAVLVSGDADFAYALQTVKNMGKYVEVAYFRAGISKDLLDVADNRHLMDRDFLAGLWAGGVKSMKRRIREPRPRQIVVPRDSGIQPVQPSSQPASSPPSPPAAGSPPPPPPPPEPSPPSSQPPGWQGERFI